MRVFLAGGGRNPVGSNALDPIPRLVRRNKPEDDNLNGYIGFMDRALMWTY